MVINRAATAQEEADNIEQAGNGLRITPPRIQDIVNQGEDKEYTINVRNITTTPVTVDPSINDFITDNEGNDPKLITDENFNSPYTLRDKVNDLESFQLEPGEEKEVVVNLSISETQTPGAYYGLVRFTAVPQDVNENSGFALSASVGSIMLIQVPGEIVESLTLVELQAAQNAEDANNGFTKSFYTSAPNQIVTRLQNQGNAFLQPFGRVVIKNMSDQEVASFELNSTEPRGNVLPDSIRRFVDEVDGIGSFGRYTIEANLAYGEGGGNIISASSTFWVIPLPAIIAGVVVILGIIGALLFGIRRYRRSHAN